jgi:protoporphyrinogen oxidase
MPMKLAIIGGAAAGTSAASQARRTAPAAELLVLEKTQDVSGGARGLPHRPTPDERMVDLQVIGLVAAEHLDLAYAPPFGPLRSPLPVAAPQLTNARG